MTQEPDRVIEESQLREILLKAYQLKCDELAHQRQVTEDAEVRLMAMNARLAAQSGYAENEEQADMQAVKKEAWEDGANWMLQRFLEVPPSIRAGLDARDGQLLSYMGKSLSDYAEQYALPNHDPRKGAEPSDPLTRYADELREEKKRLTNELARLQKGAE